MDWRCPGSVRLVKVLEKNVSISLTPCRWKNPYELKSHAMDIGMGSGSDAPVRRMVMPTTFIVCLLIVVLVLGAVCWLGGISYLVWQWTLGNLK